MKTFKKTIILSDKRDNKKSIMTLDLENKNNSVFGNLKSFSDAYTTNLLLGIKVDNNIIKQNIKLENNRCQFKLANIDLDKEISCAMVDTSNDKFEPILWGSSKNEYHKGEIVSHLRHSISRLQSNGIAQAQVNVSKVENKDCQIETNELSSKQTSIFDSIEPVKTESVEIEHEKNLSQISLEPEDINSTILPEIAIASSKPNPTELFETNENELNEIIDSNMDSSHNFYNLIADQIDELFARYPRERNLEKLVDNSMWCKIDTEFDNKYYVVGIIRNNNDIKYICYGVPGNYNVEPPIEMRDYSQWLPIDTTNPYDNGYWVMYQDSDTGENIFLN